MQKGKSKKATSKKYKNANLKGIKDNRQKGAK